MSIALQNNSNNAIQLATFVKGEDPLEKQPNITSEGPFL